MLEGVAVYVEVDAAAQFLGVEAVLLGHGDEEAEGVDMLLGAVEVDGDGGQVDVIQEGGHLLFGIYILGAEADGCGAAFEGVEGEAVGFGDIVFADVLTDVPDVAVGLLAASEGELGGVRVEILNVFEVFGAVVGFDLEALDGFPDQFFLVVGTFEVLVDYFFPFFG